MKTTQLEKSQGTLPEDREKMVATIFCPDAAYGAQLVAAFRRAIAGLGEIEALDLRPWRLDVLQWPEMQAEATHDVACSSVVVVPADEAYASSECFRWWVQGWPVSDGRRLLLVPRRGAGETPPRVRQFVHWLKEVCAQKGMDFTEGLDDDRGADSCSGGPKSAGQPRPGLAAGAASVTGGATS